MSIYHLRIQADRYMEAVLEFINKKGEFVTFTPDSNFQNMLFQTVNKQLNIQDKCINNFLKSKEVFNHLNLSKKSKTNVILFLERIIPGISVQDFIVNVKKTYPDIKLIVLTGEVDKAILVRLFELGADNFITKPMSMNTLIEKIALTYKPQSKLGELIEKSKEHLKKQEFKKALATCDEVLQLKPNSAAACMVKGDVYMQLDQKQEALQQYLTAHQNSLMYLEPMQRLVDYYSSTGAKGNQLEILEKMDKLSPLNVERKLDLGTLNMELGQKETGKKYFDQAIKTADRETKESLGNLSARIGDLVMQYDAQIAEDYYRQAVSAKKGQYVKGDVELFNRLGISLRQQNKPSEAIEEYQKALKIFPDHENLLYNISLAYMEANRLKQAKDMVEKLLHLNAKFYEISEVVCYNLGMIFYRTNDKSRAREFFRLSLKQNPDYEPARKILERMA